LVFHVGDTRTGGGTADRRAQAADSAAVVATVEQFHRALANGDSLAALALMTDDAVVLESGGFETRAEFRSHHLRADIEFARATRRGRQVRRVTVRGDAAWVSITSTAEGEFRGRPINSMGAELAVLVRTPSGWRISAVHWSSRARRG
jgi:ketosteroid isomerase-like protein